MAFSLPKNIPRFDDSQRTYENVYWTRNQTGRGKGIGNAFGGFSDGNDLPMYKDKPYRYAASNRHIPLWKRKRTLAITLVGFFFLLTFFGLSSSRKPRRSISESSIWHWFRSSAQSEVDWDQRRERVKEAFKMSWDGYQRHAWGKDEYNPLTKSGRQMAPSGPGLGFLIVDSLDTLILMNLTSQLSHARDWISTSLNYSQNYEINTFEMSTRILGGLLSAHWLSIELPELAPLSEDDEGAPGEDLYIEKATDLADRLLGAFDTGSRIPLTNVNLESHKATASPDSDGASLVAQVAGMQLEFKYLSKLLGEHIFWDAADKVSEIIDGEGMEDGLLTELMDPDTGAFKGRKIGLGGGAFSYYQCLVKQYLQTSKQEKVYHELWHQALAGILKHLISYSRNLQLTVIVERPNGLNREVSPRMDHQICSLPGTIALAVSEGVSLSMRSKANRLSSEDEEQLLLARELMKTCWTMYKVAATGLAPDVIDLTLNESLSLDGSGIVSSAAIDTHISTSDTSNSKWRSDFSINTNYAQNSQRPETIESLFYMWRITSDPMYREWAWTLFSSFVDHTASENGAGFVSISNVDALPPRQLDRMEGIWLSRTLKYFYLIFSPTDFLPLDSVVFSIGAHPFPKFIPRGFKTGWSRKPRDSNGRLTNETNKTGAVGARYEGQET